MAVSATRTTIAWVLAIDGMTDEVDDRVWDDIEADPTLPFVVVQLIGGGDTSVNPVIRPYMQIDVYADTPTDVDRIAGLITDEARNRVMVPIAAESSTVLKANWVAQRKVSEPGTGWERMAIDLLMSIREDA